MLYKARKVSGCLAEMFNKESFSWCQTEQDVSRFLKDLHSQVLEQMLQGEIFVWSIATNTKYKALLVSSHNSNLLIALFHNQAEYQNKIRVVSANKVLY